MLLPSSLSFDIVRVGKGYLINYCNFSLSHHRFINVIFKSFFIYIYFKRSIHTKLLFLR